MMNIIGVLGVQYTASVTSNQRHIGLIYFISVVPDTEVIDMQFFVSVMMKLSFLLNQ